MRPKPDPNKPASFLKKHYAKFVIFFVLLATITGIYLVLPAYLQKAFLYGYSDIYDYKIFHNRNVKTDIPQPWPISKQYNISSPSPALMDSLIRMETTGFLVAKNDSILYEYYSEESNEQTISNSFSMAKSIIGLLIGCAIDEGYIKSIHQPVEDFLPDYQNLKGKGLTIEHLLTMSSGSNWDEHYSSAFSITTKAYYGVNLDKLMQEVEIIEKPGITFNYKSGDTQFLAMILKRATGKPVAQYASEKLWKPMGAETPALWSLDKKEGMEKAYCCFNSTARDFARFGSLVLHLGHWKGEQLIPQSYVIESITPAYYLIDENNKPLNHYGYQWWILHYRGLAIPYARGLHGQYIFVIPTKNAVIVRLGHQRSDEKINDHPLDVYTWINLGLELIN